MKKAKPGRVIVRTYSAGVHYGTLVKRVGKEVELADARRVVGPAWFAGGKSLAEAIENKCAVLERIIAPQSLATRRCFVEALLRCVRDDLPPEVDAMVRNRMLSRDGGDALTTRAAIREFSAILATWVARGAP